MRRRHAASMIHRDAASSRRHRALTAATTKIDRLTDGIERTHVAFAKHDASNRNVGWSEGNITCPDLIGSSAEVLARRMEAAWLPL